MNIDHALQLKGVDTAELLDLRTFEAFKVRIPALFLTMHLIFG